MRPLTAGLTERDWCASYLHDRSGARTVLSVSDPTWQFQTYRTYLEAVAVLAGRGQEGSQVFRPAWNAAAEVNEKRRTLSAPQIAALRERLEHAWAAEALLYMNRRPDSSDELLRLTNVWAPIQGYYAGYHITQALIIADGRPRPTRHEVTQKLFHVLWGKRPGVAPWSYRWDVTGPTGLPPGTNTSVRATRTWVDLDSAPGLVGQALRTTWQDNCKLKRAAFLNDIGRELRKAYDDEQAARQQDGRRPLTRKKPKAPKSMPAGQRETFLKSVPAVTVLDLLYRLRIRSNYEDARLALDGPLDTEDTKAFHDALLYVTSALMAATEQRIAQMVPAADVLEWLESWVTRNIPPTEAAGARLRGVLHAENTRPAWRIVRRDDTYLTPIEALREHAARIPDPQRRFVAEGVLHEATARWDSKQRCLILTPSFTGLPVHDVHDGVAATLHRLPQATQRNGPVVLDYAGSKARVQPRDPDAEPF